MTARAELEVLTTAIRAAVETTSLPLSVGIDGPSGAGKSTLAAAIATELAGRVAVIEGDDFYADINWRVRAEFTPDEAYARNYDWKRLRDQVLVPARAGQASLRYQRYDWDNERMGGWIEIATPTVLIVDGVYTLRPELRDWIDVGIYVEADPGLRIARQHARHATYERPIAVRQDAMIELWDAAEVHYRGTYDPGAVAGFHVNGGDARRR